MGRGSRTLLECRKVMLNYTIHESNRTVLIKKKGQDLQSYRWLNSKLSLQEQGPISCLCDVGVTGQALRAGLQGPLCWGSSLITLRTRPRQKTHLCRTGVGWLLRLTHFLLSPFPPQTIPLLRQHYLQTTLQRPGFYISFLSVCLLV